MLSLGLIDNWLRHVQDVILEHEDVLSKIDDENQRLDRLCELNVIQQFLTWAALRLCKMRERKERSWLAGFAGWKTDCFAILVFRFLGGGVEIKLKVGKSFLPDPLLRCFLSQLRIKEFQQLLRHSDFPHHPSSKYSLADQHF